MSKSNERPLGDIIREFVRLYHLDDKLTEARIASLWEKIMGEAIAKYTTGLYLKDHKLTVYLTSAPLRNELHLASTKIIQSINREMGKVVVKTISFR